MKLHGYSVFYFPQQYSAIYTAFIDDHRYKLKPHLTCACEHQQLAKYVILRSSTCPSHHTLLYMCDFHLDTQYLFIFPAYYLTS